MAIYVWKAEQAYLREGTLFHLCSNEEANTGQELQVDCGHFNLTEAAIEEVYG